MNENIDRPVLPVPASQGTGGWGQREGAGQDERRWGDAARPRDRGYGRSMAGSTLERFLGGSPVAVLLRLIVLSLVVGALMMWLDIRPQDIVLGFERFLRRIWALGFDAVRELGDYVVAGAIIVVPIWFVLRLLNMRSAR